MNSEIIRKDEIKDVGTDVQFQKGSVKSQLQRKGRRYLYEVKQSRKKILELQKKLEQQIKPQREYIMKELVSKHEQIVELTKSIAIRKQKAIEIEQNTIKLNRQCQFEEKLLIEAVQHKGQVNRCIQKVQREIQKLSMRKEQVKLQGKSKLQQIAEQDAILQQVDTNKLVGSDQFEQKSLDQQLQNSMRFNSQLRDCLGKRFSVRVNLTQAITKKYQQMQHMNQQHSQLKIQAQQSQHTLIELKHQHQQSLKDQSQQQNNLNNIIMENTQLKARLQILRHSLTQQTNKSNLYHDQIYRNHQLDQQSQNAYSQTGQMLEQLIKIKLQAQYIQTRTKN